MALIRLSLREANGDLPMACMSCGEPATVLKPKHMQWHPPWVNFLVLLGLLPWAIVAAVLTKRARIQAPFCPKHKGHWSNRTWLIAGSLLLLPVLCVVELVIHDNLPGQLKSTAAPFLFIIGAVALVAWLVLIVVLHHTSIHPKEITDTELLLTRVSEAFVEAVAEADQQRVERKKRRRQRELDENLDESDEPGARAKPSRTEIQEEPRLRKRPRSDAIEE